MNFSEVVLPVMRSIRDIVLPHYGTAAIKHQKEREDDIVTELDIAVEDHVRTTLAELYPGVGFVGEEGGGDRLQDRFWLMDPIDGTQHFVRGLPFTTSMLAYVENGTVAFSAIYDFVKDDMYWAERGKGAYRNEERLSVSNRTMGNGYVGWESIQLKPENREYSYQLRKRLTLFNSLCAGWELAMVAAGKLDGRIAFEPYGKDYDFAPGTLLIEEAGGIVANIGENTYDYRNCNFIAANPIIFKGLTEGEDAVFPVRK